MLPLCPRNWGRGGAGTTQIWGHAKKLRRLRPQLQNRVGAYGQRTRSPGRFGWLYWQVNMDIELVTDPYACMMYIVCHHLPLILGLTRTGHARTRTRTRTLQGPGVGQGQGLDLQGQGQG